MAEHYFLPIKFLKREIYWIRRKTQELEESREEMTIKIYNYQNQKLFKPFPEIIGRVVPLDI